LLSQALYMIEFGSVVESSVIGRTEMGIALLLLSVRREDSVMFSLLINHNSHIQKEKKYQLNSSALHGTI
jgi:hypothetical protein